MHKLSANFRSFLQIVKEFLKALGQKRTYNLKQNGYCFFGILWGIPVPIVTISIQLYASNLKPTLSNIIYLTISHAFITGFFILHPLLFGIVFGAMGTVRHNKEQKIEEFEKDLINKNIELENANARLRELDKLKSNFLSMVSHELRTPLTTIQGYITFLNTEKPGALTPEQKEYLKISEETADTLNHLIEELLDLSKIESGEFKVNLTGIDMAEVINKAVASLRIFANAQGVILENNLPRDLPLVLADKERILQVVINLMENAIKFNRQEGKVSISANSKAEVHKITFCVLDTGIGIPQDKLDKIFDKFYQVDSSGKRKYGGCGLGLAITKSIVELHRGKVWVESKAGEGSKFFFELLTLN